MRESEIANFSLSSNIEGKRKKAFLIEKTASKKSEFGQFFDIQEWLSSGQLRA